MIKNNLKNNFNTNIINGVLKNFLLFGLLFFLNIGLYSQKVFASESVTVTRSLNSEIIVTGTGTINAIPDVGYIFLDIRTDNPIAKVAQSENNLKVQLILDKLKSLEISNSDILTEGFNLYPNYGQITKEGAIISTITGYTASHQLKVSVRIFENIGKIIDEVIVAGVTTINRIEFSVSDSSNYYLQALTAAGKDAKEKATTMASSLGMQIIKVEKIEEQPNFNFRPFIRRESSDFLSGSPMDIQVDNINITAKVTATFSAK